MSVKWLTYFAGLVVGFCSVGLLYGQDGLPAPSESKSKSLGIINGRAFSRPKPKYPLAARKYCADGKVEVEVMFNRAGRVINAQAISGDELLWQAAVGAAKRARFRTLHEQPARTVGILVYNFTCPWACIKLGVINDRAISIPKPSIHPNYLHGIQDKTEVDVQIVVEPTGHVISARALTGHPLVRVQLETSARGVRFTPVNASAYVRGIIRYTIKRNGEVTY